MFARFAADAVVVLHSAFIVFVICGGFLALKWRWLAFFHLPAAIWGALIEFQGWLCPLTPLEQRLRREAGDQGYAGGFIEHYVLPIIYPQELTRELQMMLGASVVVINLVAYGWLLRRRLHRSNAA